MAICCFDMVAGLLLNQRLKTGSESNYQGDKGGDDDGYSFKVNHC